MIRSRRKDQPGQILVLFVIALVAIFAMLGLLFDGGQALALRRQLQNAGDAGALAAANGIVQTGTGAGCSATYTTGSPPGDARSTLKKAAQDAVHASLPNLPNSSIDVTCPDNWNNVAVQVNLTNHSPGYFGGILGVHGFDVATTSQALNGKPPGGTKYSVVELDDSTLSYPNGFRGCPSLLFSGSNAIVFDGSVQVDSDCTAANGGALASNGNAATITVNNGASINLVGGYVPGALTIIPTPKTGQPYLKDPLLWLPSIPWATCTVAGPTCPIQKTSNYTLSGGATVLEPGIYTGGITMRNSAVAYLHPGIYVFREAANGDGGFQIGSQNKVYSIPASATSTTDGTWDTDCTTSNCGVLLFNTGMTSNAMSGPMKDNLTVGAGATVKLRPYLATADTTAGTTPDSSYDKLLMWQDRLPIPGPSYLQPPVSLSGGGQINLTGTLYAPSAAVQMGGTSGGAGGSSSVDVVLQFISWDLSFNGNIGFHFFYQSDQFVRGQDYGLIK
jgi:Flp pilus assembly protein TadG